MLSPPEPVVSVVTVVRDQARWIDGCAESVLRHDGPALEWVVVDNGSSDETPGKLREWARRDARVRVHEAGENLMQSDGLPRALTLARGRYASFVDGDDELLAGRLTKSVGWLEEAAGRVAVYGDARFIDEHDRELAPWFIARDAGALRRMAEFTMPAIHSTGTWRTDALRASCDPLPQRIMVYDYWLLTRGLEAGEVGWLPEPLCAYRVHPASESQRNVTGSLAMGMALVLVAAGRHTRRPVDPSKAMGWAKAAGQSCRTSADLNAAAARFAIGLGLPRHALFYARRAVRGGRWGSAGVAVRAVWLARRRREPVWPILRGGLLAAARVDGRGHSVESEVER